MKKLASLFVAFAFTIVLSSFAFGQTKKVDVCHRTDGGYSRINISRNALDAHMNHGDAQPGEAVPGMSGYEFTENCVVVLAQPNFVPFNIRNNNGTIAPPWDSDMSLTENTDGDGFTAVTPRGGQKVGYGTNFFDNMQLNDLNTVDWTKISGKPGIVSYLNVWVTDGTNYAIIASENDYRGTDFQTRQEWKVFEYNPAAGFNWLCANGIGGRDGAQYLTCGGVRATLADLSDVVIKSPTFSPAPAGVGTGAPRGGYGFNFIFGDTQSNFIGSYELTDISIVFNGTTYNPSN